MSGRIPPLSQRDVMLDHQVRRQPLDLEPGPRLEGLGSVELAGLQRRIDAPLDLALRRDAEVLEKLADGPVERFFVHGVTLKTSSCWPVRSVTWLATSSPTLACRPFCWFTSIEA